MTHTPILYLLIGGISTGKSTIRRTLSLGLLQQQSIDAPHNVNEICPDEIRAEISGDESDQSVNAEAWRIAYQRLEEAMRFKQDVIFDAAYMVKQKTRRIMADYAKRYGYRIVYIILGTTLEDALIANANRERRVSEDVVRRYHNNFKHAFPFVEDDRL